MYKKDYFAHPTAEISEEAEIGKDTKIWQHCTVLKDVIIGECCNIGQNVFVENGVYIGNRVKVKNNIAIYAGVTIEDDVFVGPNVVFTNVINPRSYIERKKEFRPTLIKEGASIGANSTIVCGHCVGKYAMIGAGAVVTKDVPDYALVVGNPAKRIGHVCWCGEKIEFVNDKAVCVACNKKYHMTQDKVVEI